MTDKILTSDQGEEQFRWRGKDVSRVENFSDIVFALALTLVAASSVPTTFDELTGLWRDLVAMAACFALLALIWRAHYVFFRRYDLEDERTIALNTVLLFLVLAFVYPLKFLARFTVDLTTFLITGTPDLEAIGAVLPLSDARWLIVIYSAGYAAVFTVFALLYAHAGSRQDPLGLTPKERILTRATVRESAVHIAVAVLAIALALALPAALAAWSGFVFFFIGPVLIGLTRRTRREVAGLD